MPKMTGERVSDVLRGVADVAGLTFEGYAPPFTRPGLRRAERQRTITRNHSSMERPRLLRAVQSRIRCG